MEKLELKHLAPYLPYGLKIKLHNGNITTFQSISVSGFTNGISWMKECKPILRPLSDLTKEIEHNGQKFYPCYNLFGKPFCRTHPKLESSFVDGMLNELWLENEEGDIAQCSFTKVDWDYLFEWHFDVFGLIDKGLAIDINNLK